MHIIDNFFIISYFIDYSILFLYDCSPFYIKDIIKLYMPVRPLWSQNNCLICVPYTQTAKYGDRCFMKAAASLWNPLSVFFVKFSIYLFHLLNKI